MADTPRRNRVAYDFPYRFPYDTYRGVLGQHQGYVQRVLAHGEGEKMSERIHHPKGGMCAHCQHFDKDCSHMDFSKMPVILQDDERVIVRCISFERVKPCS